MISEHSDDVEEESISTITSNDELYDELYDD